MTALSTDPSLTAVLAIRDARSQQAIATEVQRETQETVKTQGAAILRLLTEAAAFRDIITETHVDVRA